MALFRFPIRLVGLSLVAIALVLLTDDFASMDWSTISGFAPSSLGELLYGASPELLNVSQAFIQRYIWPFLWDPIIQTVLTWWDWASIGVLGLIIAALARRPEIKTDAAAVETAG